jgi:hypothetical protein
MMQVLDTVSIEDLVALPPMIFGIIRWSKYSGRPTGDICSGFNIRVEEHTATQFRAVGGGKYEPIPGTGIWKDVVDAVTCRELSDEGDYHKLSLQIWGRGIHLNAFPDGQYRITPTLKGTWSRPTNSVVFFGSRTVEPKSASVVLKKDNHIQSVEFEIVQRPRPWRTILSVAVVGAILGSALQRAQPNRWPSSQIRTG